ncbi:MAG: FtsH protease activity modulator HflK [Candidatus Hydrogenedentes bacterium]|nr:FtsH protease activity modulator HflK [Candidatus Hydrogenedentota bacterium]
MAMQRPEVIHPAGDGHQRVNVRLIAVAILALVLLIWLVKGGPAYQIEANEEGVVLTFGKFTATAQPGLHFKLPWPIQTVEKVPVGKVNRIEIGFRSIMTGDTITYDTFMNKPDLIHVAQMLTGDKNVVNCSMSVQYRIKNSQDFLFNYHEGDVHSTLEDISEAALRQAVGDHPIDDVLTTGKLEVQKAVFEKMQQLADRYRMGVTITNVQLQDVQPPNEVAAAFRDVATAHEEREKIINEAKAYQNGQIPTAEGKAEKVRQEAQGYKEARIAEATGETARFKAIAEQYALAPEVTRTRLYLEAMSTLLPKVRVTVVDKEAGIVNLKNIESRAPAPPEPAEPSSAPTARLDVEGGKR